MYRKRRAIFILGVFILFTFSFFVRRYTYAFQIELGSFSIHNIQEENNVLIMDVASSENASKYKVFGYDANDNLIYEKESDSNKIELTDLYGNYGETITFKVTAYNSDDMSMEANNSYKYIFKDASIGKSTEHFNQKGKDLVIGFDGNTFENSYKLEVYYENSLLESVDILNNMATINHQILDNLSGTVYLKVKKDNGRIVNVFPLYVNSPIVGNIHITNISEGETISWDDLTLNYEGGINATLLQVNLYQNDKLINTYETEYTGESINLPATFFSENIDCTLELKAIYKDYYEIGKIDRVNIHVKSKAQASPVYVNYNYKNIKKGTEVSLITNTPNADIFYTFDGSEPTTSSFIYNRPITIDEDVTIKAKAIRKNMYDSDTSTFNFHVGEKPLVVYLSPSNQYDNYGVAEAGYTTEKNEMNLLADELKTYLESYGVKVYRNVPSAGINAWVAESNYVKSDLHLALHSNASQTKQAHGMEMYVSKSTSASLSIASNIYNNLYQMYPYKDDTSNRGIKYSAESLGEANDNFLPCGTLLEVAYHDNYNDAKWIVEHRTEIARNIGNSILKYYQVI